LILIDANMPAAISAGHRRRSVSRAIRFLEAALRRLMGCPPYRLHCQSGDAEIVADLATVPSAMRQAYSLLTKQAAEPMWIEGPWGQIEMSYRQLDNALRLMFLSERRLEPGSGPKVMER
jgi:hypothetical protein